MLYDLFIEPLQHEWMIRGLLVSTLVSLTLGLLGSFLVLRRMSLMGDALSHTVLPGIVIAFLISNSRASIPLLLGATIAGFVTAVLIGGIHRTSKIKEDAAMGIVFTSLFALGVVLLTSQASHVDLDPDCVLYGDLLGVPSSSIWVLSTLLLITVIGIAIFYPQLLITSFDARFADSVGISSAKAHYLLMGFLALALVAAFESVGSVLAVAMLIAPGATAYLWRDSLTSLLITAAIAAVLSAVLGLYISVWINCSPAGAIVCVGFALFVISLLISPHHGLIARLLRLRRLKSRMLCENILKAAARSNVDQRYTVDKVKLLGDTGVTARLLRRNTAALVRQGYAVDEGARLRLTPAGVLEGERILRRHRLWETFLSKEFSLPDDHLHRDADELEHFISPELEAELTAHLGEPSEDPHGQPIPQTDSVEKRTEQ